MVSRLCLLVLFAIFTHKNQAQNSTIRPIRHSLHPGGRQSLDGSLPNGGCTSVNDDGDICNLQDGGTSVLVDNTILPLNGLNGDWARGLYTVARPSRTFTSIGFDFGTSVQVERVELVLFSCPQRSIRAGSMQIYTDDATNPFPQSDPVSVGTFVGGRLFGAGVNSCTNLYRVCVSLTGANNRIYYIAFPRTAGSNRVYLAETIFYNNTRTCGPDTLIPEPVTPPPVDTTTEGTTIAKQGTITTPGSTTIQSKKNTTPVQTVITTTITMQVDIDTTMSTNNNTVTVIATTAALSLLALMTVVIITAIIVIVVRLKRQTNEKSGANKHTHLEHNHYEESQKVEFQCIGTADPLAGIQTVSSVIYDNAFGYDSDTNTTKCAMPFTSTTQEDNNTPPAKLEEMYSMVQKSGKPKKKKARSESPPPIPPYRGGDVYAVVQKKKGETEDDMEAPPPVPPQTTEMMYAAVHKKK